MRRGRLDRQIRFLRAKIVDDGFSKTETWEDDGTPTWHGGLIWAAKADVSDGERWRASEVQATITTRFVVRWSAFTRDITPKDRIMCEGLTYDIFGVKEEVGRRRWLEITASARADE